MSLSLLLTFYGLLMIIKAHSCHCVGAEQAKPSPQWIPLSIAVEDCPSEMLSMAFQWVSQDQSFQKHFLTVLSENWVEINHLAHYLSAHPNDPRLSTEAIFRDIVAWLNTMESLSSGGVFGMMSRAEINLRLRRGMVDDLRKAFMPIEREYAVHKVCGGCVDELFCVCLSKDHGVSANEWDSLVSLNGG